MIVTYSVLVEGGRDLGQIRHGCNVVFLVGLYMYYNGRVATWGFGVDGSINHVVQAYVCEAWGGGIGGRLQSTTYLVHAT